MRTSTGKRSSRSRRCSARWAIPPTTRSSQLFNLVEEVDVNKVDLKEYEGRVICSDVVDKKTGEIFINKDSVLTEEHIKRIKKSNVKKLRLLVQQGNEESVIAKTISKDIVRSEEDALGAIYKQLRSGDAPDLETAKTLIDRLFFNEKRYDLGDVGRYRINSKLGARHPGHDDHADEAGYHRDHQLPDRAAAEEARGGRYRSPGQPPRADRRRTDRPAVQYRPGPHGAHDPRTDEHPGQREPDARRTW